MIKNNEMPKYLKNLLNSFQLKCAVTKGEKVKKKFQIVNYGYILGEFRDQSTI